MEGSYTLDKENRNALKSTYMRNPLLPKMLVEFLGTFALVLAVTINTRTASSEQNALAPLTVGITLWLAIVIGGHISGGHYNPAVTFSFFLRGIMSLREILAYWFAQLCGGFCAGGVAYSIMSHHLAPLAVNPDFPLYAGYIAEMVWTFFLVLMVNCISDPKYQQKTDDIMKFFAVGMVIFFGASSIGNVSGAALNPAVGTCSNLTGYAIHKDSSVLKSIGIYWAGPLSGSILAALVFTMVIKPNYEILDEKQMKEKDYAINSPQKNVPQYFS